MFEVAELALFSPQERNAYVSSLKYYRDMQGVINTAHLEGIQEGREQGIQEGIEKGIEMGIEEGKRSQRLEIARVMKAANSDRLFIAQVTGIPLEEIDRL